MRKGRRGAGRRRWSGRVGKPDTALLGVKSAAARTGGAACAGAGFPAARGNAAEGAAPSGEAKTCGNGLSVRTG